MMKSDKITTDFINMISTELSKQPYAFMSFSLFYERGIFMSA